MLKILIFDRHPNAIIAALLSSMYENPTQIAIKVTFKYNVKMVLYLL